MDLPGHLAKHAMQCYSRALPAGGGPTSVRIERLPVTLPVPLAVTAEDQAGSCPTGLVGTVTASATLRARAMRAKWRVASLRAPFDRWHVAPAASLWQPAPQLGARRRWRGQTPTRTRSLGLGSGAPLGWKPSGLALAFWRSRIATAAPQCAQRSIYSVVTVASGAQD